MKSKNYFIHFIYAGSFLLSVIFIVGYLAWSNNQIAAKQAATEKDKKIKISTCVIRSQQSYADNWAQACKKNAAEANTELSACIKSSENSAKLISSSGMESYNDLYQEYALNCKVLYKPDPQPDCQLPELIANGLNSDLKDNEQMCVALIS